MKDASYDIRSWLYQLLSGVEGVTVYSFPPKEAALPYVVIGEQAMVGEGNSTKDANIIDHEVTLEIWDEYTGNDASYVRVNKISDAILQSLREANIEGYNMIMLLVEAMVTDRMITEKNIIIYKSILLRILMEEL